MGVTGIGGMFFRSKEPDSLRQWYQHHLGVAPEGYAPWEQAAGPTMIMPFANDTDYWPEGRQWMINFRVTGLDELTDRLRQSGIEVVTNPAWNTPEAGQFARIHDPEGNPIELWEPPTD